MKTHTLEAHQFVELILTHDFRSSQHHSIKKQTYLTSKPTYNFWSFDIFQVMKTHVITLTIAVVILLDAISTTETRPYCGCGNDIRFCINRCIKRSRFSSRCRQWCKKGMQMCVRSCNRNRSRREVGEPMLDELVGKQL